MTDIVIIGGGVTGCAVARELSRYKAKIVLLEKGNDVSVGTSKANSGIVHAGFDALPATKKAKYNVAGNAMFGRLARELDFPFRRNGSLVLCFDDERRSGLEELLERGKQNGVPELSIIGGDELRGLEPYVSERAVAALYAKTGGIVSPYEMTIAYAENACTNGVEFRFGHTVENIQSGEGSFTVTCAGGEKLECRVVINCAGVRADEINNLVCPEKLHITARKGDYMLLDKSCGYLCTRTLFQLPTAMGKGVLVTPTTHGNILLGPTSTDKEGKDDVGTTVEELAQAFEKALITMPSLSKRNIITQFSGLRAHESGDDFIVGESSVKGFYNVAGIESPGLTAAPAIAIDIAAQVAAALHLSENEAFNPVRKGIPQFSRLSDEERSKLIAQNPLYGKVVCRCETVTEGEIVDSIRRPLGAKDLDGIKRRTRAGMGRCQAGFCTPRLMEILARELGCDLAEVTKCGGSSQIVTGRTGQ